MHFVEGNTRTCKASGAIAQGKLVKFDSGGTVTAAGLADQPIGVTEKEAFAANDLIPVRLLSASGTICVQAAGAFSAGAKVYGRAAGQVDDISTSSAVLIGVALEAATAQNDLVEVAVV